MWQIRRWKLNKKTSRNQSKRKNQIPMFITEPGVSESAASPLNKPRSLRERTASLPTHVRGVALVAAAALCFAAMHNTIRYLTAEIHPFEVAFFRNAFGFIAISPWLIGRGRDAFKTQWLGKHMVRAVFNALAMLTWYMALSLVPVADASTLSLVGPLFVALGAIWFLGETVSRRRWFGIGVAASGALIIIRPGFESVSVGTWLILLSAASVSVSKLIAKSLSRTDNTATIVGYLALIMMPLTLVPALTVWRWPTPGEWGWFALIGAFGTTAHLLFIHAYKLADVSLVEAAMMMRVVWAALIGLAVFSEFPDVWTWLGAAIVVTGTTYITRSYAAPARHTGDTLP